jgi:hypothetical protein
MTDKIFVEVLGEPPFEVGIIYGASPQEMLEVLLETATQRDDRRICLFTPNKFDLPGGINRVFDTSLDPLDFVNPREGDLAVVDLTAAPTLLVMQQLLQLLYMVSFKLVFLYPPDKSRRMELDALIQWCAGTIPLLTFH